jgi:hypothetical protein
MRSPDLYLQTAKDPKEIGWELAMQCRDMFFMGGSVFVIKFDVIYAWVQASPLDIVFLISHEPLIGIWAGFFYSVDMVFPHIMSSFLLNLGEIWLYITQNTTNRRISYHFGNNNRLKAPKSLQVKFSEYRKSIKGIYKEIPSQELEQFMFEGVAGMYATTYEIGIFHVW